MTRKLPYHDLKADHLVTFAIASGKLPAEPQYSAALGPETLWDLCKRCWTRKPEERPSIRTLWRNIGWFNIAGWIHDSDIFSRYFIGDAFPDVLESLLATPRDQVPVICLCSLINKMSCQQIRMLAGRPIWLGRFLGADMKRGIAAVFRRVLFPQHLLQHPATRRGRVSPGSLTKTTTPRRPCRKLTTSRSRSRQRTQRMWVPFPPELHLVAAAIAVLVRGLQIHRLRRTGTPIPVNRVWQTHYPRSDPRSIAKHRTLWILSGAPDKCATFLSFYIPSPMKPTLTVHY